MPCSDAVSLKRVYYVTYQTSSSTLNSEYT